MTDRNDLILVLGIRVTLQQDGSHAMCQTHHINAALRQARVRVVRSLSNMPLGCGAMENFDNTLNLPPRNDLTLVLGIRVTLQQDGSHAMYQTRHLNAAVRQARVRVVQSLPNMPLGMWSDGKL
ncbi:MAG: hypothetical protein BJ554DRAFT_2915 [Olpidium bornovanus]|uniref:Uncharacterized protein n=1 Tax=Olpidium bornovanus TaxID=278681 RepID=A0A8H8DGA9_9FUNG|nr:MAG: hypothetical protein BJ554DRAFT_2915 [Olpidium bornovanus]